MILGELETIRRWIREGKAVEVMPEHQNAGIRNPDYRVNGRLTEVKSRSDALSSRWIKDRIAEANDQIKNSGLKETGVAEFQLRGPEAAAATLDQIERQVLGTFKNTTARSLDGVAVYKDGILFAQWRRTPDCTVVRVVTPPGAP